MAYGQIHCSVEAANENKKNEQICFETDLFNSNL